MITPMHQTVFGPELGNCWNTCIAMITGIPLEEIPTFGANNNKEWWGDTARWLAARGWVGIYIARDAWVAKKACFWTAKETGVPMILGGPSPRFEGVGHAVVLCEGKQYDPHPEGAGFDLADVEHVAILFPVASFRKKEAA